MKNKHANFWEWFSKNNEAYFNFEQNQNVLFTQLKTELNKIHPDLVFEFSPILGNGKREFVISADGIVSVFPVVIDLVSKAPDLSNWDIIAFRQPHKKVTQIHYNNLIVKFENVFFRFGKANGKIALELNIRGFYESPEWTGATFILLDTILGEYHTEMSLSSIEKKLLEEVDLNDLYPINALPKVIQDYHLETNN
jgi:hypothetical protein